MPSCQLISQSGGIGLVSGAVFSGTGFPKGGIQLLLQKSAPGNVSVAIPPLSGWISGYSTYSSGGSLSSGGFTDGFELTPGDSFFFPNCRLVSGVESIRINVPAASSGARMFWDAF